MIASTPSTPNSTHGFLIDLDLAICLVPSPTTASSAPHRTERWNSWVSTSSSDISTHTATASNHSYIFLQIYTLHDSRSRPRKNPTNILASWSQHNFALAAVIKEGYMAATGYERLLNEFTNFLVGSKWYGLRGSGEMRRSERSKGFRRRGR